MSETNRAPGAMSRLMVAFALLLAATAFFGQPSAQATHSYKDVVRVDNVSAPGANTDILDAAGETAVAWTSTDPARITVCLATSSVFNVMWDPAGAGAEVALQLNESALTAGVEYTFDLYGLDSGDALEFQVETDSVVNKLSVGRLKKD